MFNDTFYGPIYPFSEIFTQMGEREFLKFWQQLGHMGTIDEAVEKFELTFTRYFTDCGYEKAVYCDVTSYEEKIR